MTLRIVPVYFGPELDADTTWLVTYEVRGVEDGPMVNMFRLTGDMTTSKSEEFAQVRSRRSKITVKVTEVMAE